MKKHFILLSTALAAFGMTGCIDNEEPSSLEELRQAQAEKLKAEANKENATANKTNVEADAAKALIASNVAINEAKAASEKALAAQQEEKAAQAKITTLTQQLAYEIAAAKKDDAIAENKAQHDVNIAKLEAELITEAGKIESNKVNVEASLATAEAALANAKSSLATAEASAEKNILTQEVEILVAAAQLQDPVNGSNATLKTAYTTLKTAEKALIDANNTLVEKTEDLVVALGNASRDSITTLVSKQVALLSKEQAITTKEKAVAYAEAALAAAEKEVAAGDKADWAKVYEEQDAVIKGIQNELNELEYAVVEATKAKTDAQTAYTNAKKELDKELTEYKNAKKFYQFTTKNEEIQKALKDQSWGSFKYKEGVISNETEIANSALESTASGLINYLNAKLYTTAKKAEATQIVAELNGQIAKFEADYKADKADFDAAVKAFDEAALNFQWSKDAGKSLVYEKAVADYEAMINKNGTLNYEADLFTSYAKMRIAQKKYEGIADKTSDEAKKAYSEQETAEKAFTAEFNKLAAILNPYYALRKAFDGFESNIKGTKTEGTGASQKTTDVLLSKVAAKDVATIDAQALFEALYILYYNTNADGSFKNVYSIYTTSYTGIFGYSTPQNYDSKVGYGLYSAKAQKLMGNGYSRNYVLTQEGEYSGYQILTYARQVELTDAEIKAIAKNYSVSELQNYGSQGLYNYAKLDLEEKSNDLKNQEDWAALLKQVTDVVSANKKKIAELEAAAQLSYASLQDEVDALAAATVALNDLNDQKTALNTIKSNAEAFKAEALTLSGLMQKDIEAYAVYAQYELQSKKDAIESAKNDVETAKANLAKAEAELEAYVNGTLVNETAISNAQVAVEKAEADAKTAQEKYDLAKAAYDNVLAAVKKAIAQ